MKTLLQNKTSKQGFPGNDNLFVPNHTSLRVKRNRFNPQSERLTYSHLKSDIFFKMSSGQLPDLIDLSNTFLHVLNNTTSVDPLKDLVPVLQAQPNLEKKDVKLFLKDDETRHELISTDNFKLVLIHWRPGKVSDVHGHDEYSCMFKVLLGKLEEVRYTPDKKSDFIASSHYRTRALGYIDDNIAYHQVGNPYGSSAVSIHAYCRD